MTNGLRARFSGMVSERHSGGLRRNLISAMKKLIPLEDRSGRGFNRASAILASALVLWLLCMGLFYVWTRMQLVELGYEIAALEKKNEELKKRQRELSVEMASLQSPSELEKQARKRAGLVFPAVGRVVHVP
ncbi:MAG: septum formation initiator family protein [Deltaproteobacteria bacterium]|nr:septum formation initiator family protein [Deltaproteobacteria bacterium]